MLSSRYFGPFTALLVIMLILIVFMNNSALHCELKDRGVGFCIILAVWRVSYFAQKHSCTCTWKLSEHKIANGELQLHSKQKDYSLSFFQKIPQPCGLLLRYRKACIAPSYESFGLGSQLVFHSDSACQLKRFTELSHHRKTGMWPAEALLFYLISRIHLCWHSTFTFHQSLSATTSHNDR